jgi:hypothetical protein
MLLSLVINFQNVMVVSRATILSIVTFDVMSSFSALLTVSIVRRLQVGPSLLTKNIRKAFHKFGVIPIEILSLFYSRTELFSVTETRVH